MATFISAAVCRIRRRTDGFAVCGGGKRSSNASLARSEVVVQTADRHIADAIADMIGKRDSSDEDDGTVPRDDPDDGAVGALVPSR
ncbi:MAG: hypothetical protein GXX79_13705 [Actinomycetales bacterium]|nr:hypothetical protein [Actinomycetales bacterium]